MEIVERNAANAWPPGQSAGVLAVDVPSAAASAISARRRTYTSASKDVTGTTVLANHPFTKQSSQSLQPSPTSPQKRYNSYRNSAGPKPQHQARGPLRRVPIDVNMAESKPADAQNEQTSVSTCTHTGKACPAH
jgi:hypothetical protein